MKIPAIQALSNRTRVIPWLITVDLWALSCENDLENSPKSSTLRLVQKAAILIYLGCQTSFAQAQKDPISMQCAQIGKTHSRHHEFHLYRALLPSISSSNGLSSSSLEELLLIKLLNRAAFSVYSPVLYISVDCARTLPRTTRTFGISRMSVDHHTYVSSCIYIHIHKRISFITRPIFVRS